MKKKTAILLAFALAAASCEIPFELDNVSEPAFYVQYIPHAGVCNGMTVAYAEPVFDKLEGLPHAFNPANVHVTVNGKAVSVTEDKESSSWNSHMLLLGVTPAPGDEVEVSVTGQDVPEAVAKTTVPQPPVISSVHMSADTSGMCTIKLKLAEAVKDGEFYGLKAAKRSTMVQIMGYGDPEQPTATVMDTTVSITYFMPGRVATVADLNSLDLDAYANIDYTDGFIGLDGYGREMMALLQKRHFESDTYTFFANSFDAFNAGDFDIGFDMGDDIYYEPEDPVEPDIPEDPDYPGDEEVEDPDAPDFWVIQEIAVEYRFEIFRLSEEFYSYAKAQYLCSYNMLSNFGVTPPNFTYSNVSGGLGVVAGVSSAATDWLPAPEPEE